MKRLLITSALPYANGSIHLGHLVEYIQTDIFSRFNKLIGRDTLYVCANDTHGAPIEMNAMKKGITPQELVEGYYHEHLKDFQDFQVDFDIFYTTNSPENRHYADLIFNAAKDQGYIYQKPLQLFYCPEDKRFLPDRYVKGVCPKCGANDQYGDVCERCNSTYNPTELKEPYCSLCHQSPIVKESTHYFFKLKEFQQWLGEWLNNEDMLKPEIRNYVLRWVKDGLEDWCISRDGPYFGFLIPGEKDKYYYVWLDAPIGYISATQKYCSERGLTADHYWKSDESEIIHFIGKDIVYFHTLFWPVMLKVSGFNLPSSVKVHGFLTVNREKMSKSRGTFISAADFKRFLDPQYLRYYYAGSLSSGIDDIDLSFEDFKNRINGELIGNLVNFCNRTIKFCQKMDKKIYPWQWDQERSNIRDESLSRLEKIRDLYAQLEFRKVISLTNEISDLGNRYFQSSAPWSLLKNSPEEAGAVVAFSLNLVQIIVTVLKPVLPQMCAEIEKQMGLEDGKWPQDREFFTLQEGEINYSAPLLSRVDQKKIDALLAEQTEGNSPEPAKAEVSPKSSGGRIDFKQFEKIDIRVGEIKSAERVKKSDKLLKIEVDVGEEEVRTVVAGIGQSYQPEELVGKRVAVLVNLKPAKIFGIKSNGMLLAAGPGGSEVVLAEFGRPVETGEPVR